MGKRISLVCVLTKNCLSFSIVGEPIEIKKVENPSVEEVSAKHDEYLSALSALFEKHKTKYGISEDSHLEFC